MTDLTNLSQRELTQSFQTQTELVLSASRSPKKPLARSFNLQAEPPKLPASPAHSAALGSYVLCVGWAPAIACG